MIKIFDSNDKNFSSNGNIAINPLKCLETKKKSLNGWYLDIEVPIEYKDYISKDKIVVVKVKSKLNPQAFRINDNIEYTTRKISFTADHVMFDSKNYFLLDVRPTNMNALNSLIYINERTDNTSPFTIIESNVQGTDTSYFIRKSLFEAWTTIEEKFNGVFDADNFNISFNISTGTDRGEVICYGKNAQSVKIFEDWSEVCTKICPVGKDGLLLPERYLVSNKQYTQPYTRTISFETALEEEQQTEENLIAELRTNAENYLNSHNEPKVSYEVKSDINQLCEIGDTIHVKHPLINLITNVIEYEYDTNLEKIKTLTFGNYTRDVKTKFDSIKTSINTLKEAVNTQNTIINEQTELINTLNKNGYVYIDDNEILILDSLPKETAQNVWRFGLGGIGFSSNGYEGPFETAITQDGKINANFIQVGQMSTSRIQGLDELILEINKIVDLTNTKENINYLFLDNAMEGQLIELTLKGNIDLIYPEDDLYPSDDLYPLDTYLIVDTARTLTENAKKYHLPIKQLKSTDTFKYSKGNCYIIHEDESIDELGELDIQLFEGNNYIYLESFPNNILPNGYTQVEYIEAHHAEYINTGYYPNPNSRIESIFQFTETTPKQMRVFGNVHTEEGGLSVNFYINGSGKFAWSCQNRVGNWLSTYIDADTEKHKFIIDIKNSKVYLDNIYESSISVEHTNTAINSLLLLAYRGYNSGTSNIDKNTQAYGKLYSTKIYENDILVKDFIPCYRNSDNKVGLYDIVNNVFYTNQGTGNFTSGPLAKDILFIANYVLKNDYTDVFSTKAEMNSAINQTNQTIDLKLEKKTDKDSIIAQINMSTEKDKDGSYIGIEADKLNFKGKVINLTGDSIKIKGENLDIDSQGIITLNDNSASNALSAEELESAYIIKSEDTVERAGTIEKLKFINQIIANGKRTKVEDNWEYENTSGGIINGINEFVYSQPRLVLYSQSKDYDPINSIGSYNDLSLSLNGGISYSNINNGSLSTPLSITSSGRITCVSLTQTSREEFKKNFEKLLNAKEILNNVDIYKYNYKDENNSIKKSIGFVIGEKFNYSKEITSQDNDGVNIYSMVSVLWQVVKEQQEEIKELKEMIKNA